MGAKTSSSARTSRSRAIATKVASCRATVRMAKAAVVFVHKAKGEPSPITDDVIEVMRGLAASKATEHGRGQAKAITRDDFAVILARVGEPRRLGRGMETAETAAERAQPRPGHRWGTLPPTRPRLGFDAIEKRRNFRGVIPESVL